MLEYVSNACRGEVGDVEHDAETFDLFHEVDTEFGQPPSSACLRDAVGGLVAKVPGDATVSETETVKGLQHREVAL